MYHATTTYPPYSHIARRPFCIPTNHRAALVKLNRQPNIPCVAWVLRSPHISHENIRVAYMQHIGALPTKSFFGFGPHAGIRVLQPWPPNVVCRKHTGFIRIPTCTARRYHPILAILLKYGRSLIHSPRSHTYIFSGVGRIIICKLSHLNCQVIF